MAALVAVALLLGLPITLAQKQVANWEGHDGMVRGVAFSPDGKWVASAGSIDVDKNAWSIKVYDIQAEDSAKWALVRGIKPPQPKFKMDDTQMMIVLFSPDSKKLVTGDDRSIGHVYDISAEKPEDWKHLRGMKLHRDGWVRAMAFSPDGTVIYSTSDDSTTVRFDISNPDPDQWTKRRILKGHRMGNYGLSVSPDGKKIATSGADLAIRVWDTSDPDPATWKEKELKKFTGHTRLPRNVLWTHDGNHLLTSSDDSTGMVLDVASNDPKEWKEAALSTLKGHTTVTMGVTISSDSNYIATGSSDSFIKIWTRTGDDMTSWKCALTFGCGGEENFNRIQEGHPPDPTCVGHTSAIRYLDISGTATAKRFLLGSVSDDGTLRIWDMKSIEDPKHHGSGTVIGQEEPKKDSKAKEEAEL
jgi:WD40 repeat protein